MSMRFGAQEEKARVPVILKNLALIVHRDSRDAANHLFWLAQGLRTRPCKGWVQIYPRFISSIHARYTVPSRRAVWPSFAQYIHRNFTAHPFQRSVQIWILLGRWFCNMTAQCGRLSIMNLCPGHVWLQPQRFAFHSSKRSRFQPYKL